MIKYSLYLWYNANYKYAQMLKFKLLTSERGGRSEVNELNYDKAHCCCFFGHRKITKTEELRDKLYAVVENLIKDYEVYTFLFGSKSEFDDLCFSIVTKLNGVLYFKYSRQTH